MPLGSQIAYIGSPLVVPSWTILNVLASLVFWIYIVSPALYYTNTWYAAHLPFQSNNVYDNTGKTYNVSRVINKSDNFSFNATRYEEYSPVYLPVTYALNTFGLCFATLASLLVWLFLEKRDAFVRVYKSSGFGHVLSSGDKVSDRGPQPQYKAVPTWWYLIALLVAVGFGIFACEFYPVQLRWHGALFPFVISMIFFVPVSCLPHSFVLCCVTRAD